MTPISSITPEYRSRRLGAIIWLSIIQYYIVQLMAAAAWSNQNAYSWTYNTISDLANTVCGQYGVRLVCSPLHPLMNASFIVLGVTMIGGAALLAKNHSDSRLTRIGFACMALAGVGPILVGLFPENSIGALHITGAGLSFVLGNVALLIFGVSFKKLPGWARAVTGLSGLISLIALVLFLQKAYLGLGIGGLERIVAYPQSLWMIIYGGYLLIRSDR